MFGIKTFCIDLLDRNWRHRLTNDKLIRELMTHFKADERGHQANIDTADMGYGWLHYGLIRHLKPHRILVVGSGYGYIPAVLAQACHDNGYGHVDFVDAGYGHHYRRSYTWVGFWKTIEGQSIFRSFEMSSLSTFVTQFLMRTSEFFKKHNNLEYDYIYIDGDHVYKGVKFDVDHSLPLLKQGGFLALHDISIIDPMPEGSYGVNKVWNELVKKNYLVFHHPISGLGIFQKT